MDNRDLRSDNPRHCGYATGGDPHSPYLSHWRAEYSAAKGYEIYIETTTVDDCFAQWDWDADEWMTDYLPDQPDLDKYYPVPSPDNSLELWGMRGCAVAITGDGDYMVAGTARLDMSGHDPGEELIVEDYQLFLAVFNEADIDGPYNGGAARHGISSKRINLIDQQWWLFGTSLHDEGVSLRKWASGTCLPSGAFVVVGTQRRVNQFPISWKAYVCYMPDETLFDSSESSEGQICRESNVLGSLRVSYMPASESLCLLLPSSVTGAVSLELFDLSGRIVGSTCIESNVGSPVNVPLSSFSSAQLPAGVYVVLLRSGGVTDTFDSVVIR